MDHYTFFSQPSSSTHPLSQDMETVLKAMKQVIRKFFEEIDDWIQKLEICPLEDHFYH